MTIRYDKTGLQDEIGHLAADYYTACEECGSEPGCNIDCFLCCGDAGACILAFNEQGKVLGVSRKDDPNDWGMPGGRVESGESSIAAAIRELKEETGLDAIDPILCFAEKSNYLFCYTFRADVVGVIKTNEEGRVRWIDPSLLLKGTFASYNIRMFKQLGML